MDYFDAAPLGTIIELPDGRRGTTVYNSLTGIGIKWGEHNPNPADFEGTDGNVVSDGAPEGWQWSPDAMLREPEAEDVLGMPCVGEEFVIIRKGLGETYAR